LGEKINEARKKQSKNGKDLWEQVFLDMKNSDEVIWLFSF